MNLVKAIGPIRSVVNLTGAVYGLFRKPYKAYMNDKGLVKGIGEGAYQFYSVIAEESGFISKKVGHFIYLHLYYSYFKECQW